jgi:acyl carrier protein
MFRLEKSFNIKIPRGELMPENLVSDPTLVSEGKVTPKGIALLKEKMPFSPNISEFEADPELEKMSKLFTVETIVNFVEWKLANPTVETPAPTEFPDTSKKD